MAADQHCSYRMKQALQITMNINLFKLCLLKLIFSTELVLDLSYDLLK